MTWTCPSCSRPFARQRTHACAPGLIESEYFATGPAHEQPIYEAVRPMVDRIAAEHGADDLIVEFVSVGVFFKRRRNFAELRPKTKWVALGFALGRELDSPRIARRAKGGRTSATTYHTVNLRSPDEIDAELEGWLTEAFLAAAPRQPR